MKGRERKGEARVLKMLHDDTKNNIYRKVNRCPRNSSALHPCNKHQRVTFQDFLQAKEKYWGIATQQMCFRTECSLWHAPSREEREKNTIEKSSNSQILHQIDTWINFEPSHTSPIAPIQPNPYPPSFPHPSSFPPPASPFPPHPHPSFNCHPLQTSNSKDHLPYPATSLPLSVARDPTRGFP